MTWLEALILGLVEGITEYLPVSSTGHLILASALLGLDDAERKASVDAFTVVIQGGAILAVLGLYLPRVIQMLRGLFGSDVAGRKLLINLFIAFLPAAVIGLLLEPLISEHLFSPVPVLAALFLGGVWMIWIDRFRKKRAHAQTHEEAREKEITIDGMTWKHALAIGCFQVVAMWPGTSRSMMTIAGGTLMGLRPKEAAEFSFLLGLPTLGGACVYKLYGNLRAAEAAGEPNLFEQLGYVPVAVGILVATISAALAVRWLVAFLTKHGLRSFGWYRIALSIVMGAMIAAGVVTF